MPNGYMLTGEGDDLIVAMTGAFQPEGHFNFVKSLENFPARRLHLATIRNSFYHLGVPGLGTDIPETTAALRRIIDREKPKRLHFFGSSLGAYGAILFGSQLGADTVIAVNGGFDLETVVQGPEALERGETDPLFVNLFPAVAASPGTQYYLLNSSYFPPDAYQSVMLGRLPHCRGIWHHFGHDFREIIRRITVHDLIQHLLSGHPEKVAAALNGCMASPHPDPRYAIRLGDAIRAVRKALPERRTKLAALASDFDCCDIGLHFYAQSLVEQGHHEQAADIFQAILGRDGARLGAFQGLAMAMAGLKQYADALQILETLKGYAPCNAELHMDMERIYLLSDNFPKMIEAGQIVRLLCEGRDTYLQIGGTPEIADQYETEYIRTSH